MTPIQTFDIAQDPLTIGIYSAVMIKVKSNWVNKFYIDTYRTRIQGLHVDQ